MRRVVVFSSVNNALSLGAARFRPSKRGGPEGTRRRGDERRRGGAKGNKLTDVDARPPDRRVLRSDAVGQPALQQGHPRAVSGGYARGAYATGPSPDHDQVVVVLLLLLLLVSPAPFPRRGGRHIDDLVDGGGGGGRGETKTTGGGGHRLERGGGVATIAVVADEDAADGIMVMVVVVMIESEGGGYGG